MFPGVAIIQNGKQACIITSLFIYIYTHTNARARTHTHRHPSHTHTHPAPSNMYIYTYITLHPCPQDLSETLALCGMLVASLFSVYVMAWCLTTMNSGLTVFGECVRGWLGELVVRLVGWLVGWLHGSQNRQTEQT